MNIGQAKQEIENTVRAYTKKKADGSYAIPAVHQRPVLLIGPPGIGKTAIMEQIAGSLQIGLVAYTITHHTRQSAIGLPVIEKRLFDGKEYTVTEYTMSEIVASVYRCMEQTGCREGILFIDEINGVSETLAPTMLQFLQCKTFGSHKIPEGWVIVAAGNPPEYNKSVREFDMVTLDRIKRIEVTEDYAVWKSYAREHEIHPSIPAYLDVRRENFYRTEANAEGHYFVTARGWEDLSRMMYVYEELGLSVTDEFVFQYIQQPEVAKDFAGFYSLCRKYQEDYAFLELLDGTMEEAAVKAKEERLKRAGYDERLAVVSLLLGAVHAALAQYSAKEREIRSLFEEVRRLKNSLDILRPEEADEMLCREIEKRQHALEVKKEAGLYREDEAFLAGYVTDWVRRFLYEWKKVKNREECTASSFLKETFGREKVKLDESREDMQRLLERAFAFAGEAFAGGQEMAVFTEEISRDDTVMKFIMDNGCRVYQKAGEILQTEKRERELREEIRQLADCLQTGEKFS